MRLCAFLETNFYVRKHNFVGLSSLNCIFWYFTILLSIFPLISIFKSISKSLKPKIIYHIYSYIHINIFECCLLPYILQYTSICIIYYMKQYYKNRLMDRKEKKKSCSQWFHNFRKVCLIIATKLILRLFLRLKNVQHMYEYRHTIYFIYFFVVHKVSQSPVELIIYSSLELHF